jgi:hypothetical protein
LLRQREALRRGLRRANLAWVVSVAVIAALAFGVVWKAGQSTREGERANRLANQAAQEAARANAEAARAKAELWEVRGGRRLLTETRVAYTQFSPDGRQLVVQSGRFAGRIGTPLLGRTGFRTVLQSGRMGRHASDVTFSRDGRLAATDYYGSAGLSNVTRLWDAATGRELARLPGRSPVFLPDNESLLACTASGVFRFDLSPAGQVAGGSHWLEGVEILRRERAASLEGLFNSLSLAPDDRTLVISSSGAGVGLFDLVAERPLRRLTNVVAYYASLSADGEVIEWDIPVVRAELTKLGLDWHDQSGTNSLLTQHATRGTNGIGVRPSPGAETSDRPTVPRHSQALVTSRDAAPGDGRTPVNGNNARKIFRPAPSLPSPPGPPACSRLWRASLFLRTNAGCWRAARRPRSSPPKARSNSDRRNTSFFKARRWKRSARWPRAWRMTSTICSPSSACRASSWTARQRRVDHPGASDRLFRTGRGRRAPTQDCFRCG